MDTVRVVNVTGEAPYAVENMSKLLQYMSMNKVGPNEFAYDNIGQLQGAVRALQALCDGDIALELTGRNQIITGKHN